MMCVLLRIDWTKSFEGMDPPADDRHVCPGPGSRPGTRAMAGAMAAAQAQPLSFAVGTITGERGNCEGSHVVAVVASSSNPTDEGRQRLYDVTERLLVGNGACNGFRSVRMVAAGEMTGATLNIFYTDSVDGFLAGSAASLTDQEFQAARAELGGEIHDRIVSRMV